MFSFCNFEVRAPTRRDSNSSSTDIGGKKKYTSHSHFLPHTRHHNKLPPRACRASSAAHSQGQQCRTRHGPRSWSPGRTAARCPCQPQGLQKWEGESKSKIDVLRQALCIIHLLLFIFGLCYNKSGHWLIILALPYCKNYFVYSKHSLKFTGNPLEH